MQSKQGLEWKWVLWQEGVLPTQRDNTAWVSP